MKTRKWIWLLSGLLICFSPFAQTLTKNPIPISNEARCYYQQGDSLEKVFNYFHALQAYQKGFELDSSVVFLRKITQCYLKRGQYMACKETFNQIPTDSLTQTDWRFKYNLHRLLAENDSMLLIGKRIIEKYPFDSEVVAGIASSYNTMEMPDSALIITEKYRQLDSMNVFVNQQHAFAYYLKKEYGRALPLYQALLAVNANRSSTYYYIGLCFAQLDLLGQAYKNLKQAYEIDKENPHILSQFGILSMEIGEKEKGIRLVEEAIGRFQPDKELMFTLHNSIANAYLSMQEYKKGVKYLHRSLEFKPEMLFPLYKLARTYGLLNNVKQEKRYYEQYVKGVEAVEDPSDAMKQLAEESKARLQAIKEEEFMKGELRE